jgi:sialidase-1
MLKANASIDSKIELHTTALMDGSTSMQPITEEKANFRKYSGIVLRKAWDDSVHTYRIPGITTTDKGTLLAVYDIRYKHIR